MYSNNWPQYGDGHVYVVYAWSRYVLLLAGEIHKPFQMTIGELRDELEDWPESYEIIFGCEELEFYRFKKRGADTVQLEFNQTIYKDAKTGKWHVDE